MTGLQLIKNRPKEDVVGHLNLFGRAQLLDQWGQTLKRSVPPNTSQDMMRLIIGWELQATKARADVRALNAAVRHLLKPSAASAKLIKSKVTLSSGTRLSRDWQGRTYSVDVLDKGFAYDGHLYGSLSPIARKITGIHRSGPQFFGVSK